MRYHKGSIEETAVAAEAHCRKVQKPVYVYGTYYGLLITDSPPKFQSYFEVLPDASKVSGVTVGLIQYCGPEKGE